MRNLLLKGRNNNKKKKIERKLERKSCKKLKNKSQPLKIQDSSKYRKQNFLKMLRKSKKKLTKTELK